MDAYCRYIDPVKCGYILANSTGWASTLKSFGGYGCDYLNPGHVATIMGIWTKPNGELRTNDSWVAAKKQKTKKKQQQTRLGHDKPRFHKFRQIPLWFHWSGIASADCRI